jgi:hypothetical protein
MSQKESEIYGSRMNQALRRTQFKVSKTNSWPFVAFEQKTGAREVLTILKQLISLRAGRKLIPSLLEWSVRSLGVEEKTNIGKTVKRKHHRHEG